MKLQRFFSTSSGRRLASWQFYDMISVKKGDARAKVSENLEKQLYNKAFKKLDLDNDGVISKDDLEEIFGKILSVDDEEVKRRVARFLAHTDRTKDGGLSLPEFYEFMQDAKLHLQRVFAELDKDNDGVVDAHELFESCQHISDVDIVRIKQIIKTIDTNQSGSISLEEFCDYYLVEQIDRYLPSFLSSKKDFLTYIWKDFASIIDLGEGTVPVISVDVTEKTTGWRWLKQLAAGGLAGAVSRTFTAPLDRIKVIMQAKASHTLDIGLVNGFRHMLSEGGLKSLWRGNGINVIKVAPETALKFYFYERVKSLIRHDGQLSKLDRFTAGACAGALSQTFIYPLEVLKTRLALRKTGEFPGGILDCILKIGRQEGVMNFYRGYLPNLMGILPYAGIDLMCYETFKRIVVQARGAEEPSVITVLSCGAASSSCGQLVTYPLALIRTRMQAHGTTSLRSQGNMGRIVRTIWHEEGPFGFYRGIVPNFMKVIPAVSISYLVYEQSKKRLGLDSY